MAAAASALLVLPPSKSSGSAAISQLEGASGAWNATPLMAAVIFFSSSLPSAGAGHGAGLSFSLEAERPAGSACPSAV